MTRSREAAAARQRHAQAALARVRRARRRRQLVAAGAVAAVLIVLGALVVVRVVGGGRHPAPAAAAAGAVPAAVLAQVTAVPPATLAAVGLGSATGLPKPITGSPPPLQVSGRPAILYVGAEYCPYCAAERWAMVVALSRFGSFTGLSATHSSASDVFPNTATFSFHGATYTSRYVAFTGVETQTNQLQGGQYTPLDRLTAQQQQLLATYDAPPYVPASSAGAIPFIDFGNRYLVSGAGYDPGLLAGKTMPQISGALADPASPIARGVDGTANALTATICRLTGDQPAAVCQSPTIRTLAAHINAG